MSLKLPEYFLKLSPQLLKEYIHEDDKDEDEGEGEAEAEEIHIPPEYQPPMVLKLDLHKDCFEMLKICDYWQTQQVPKEVLDYVVDNYSSMKGHQTHIPWLKVFLEFPKLEWPWRVARLGIPYLLDYVLRLGIGTNPEKAKALRDLGFSYFYEQTQAERRKIMYGVVFSRNLECLKVVVKHGISRSHLSQIDIARLGLLDFLEYLDHHQKLNRSHLLYYACKHNRVECVKFLLSRNHVLYPHLAIREIAQCGYLEVLKLLIEEGGYTIDTTVMDGAIVSQNLELVQYLNSLGCPRSSLIVQIADVFEDKTIKEYLEKTAKLQKPQKRKFNS